MQNEGVICSKMLRNELQRKDHGVCALYTKHSNVKANVSCLFLPFLYEEMGGKKKNKIKRSSNVLCIFVAR